MRTAVRRRTAPLQRRAKKPGFSGLRIGIPVARASFPAAHSIKPPVKEEPMHQVRSRRGPIAAACLTLALLALFATYPCMADQSASKTKAPAAGEIDINRASAEQLTRIPGIGKVMAERIVLFRKEHGPFKRVEDLLKIKGIGEKSFERIRPYVKIGKSK
jgi:comEA protein